MVRGELIVQNKPEPPGRAIKAARERAGVTVETLAERAGITVRYLYRIEDEGQKPSYDVLFRLIRGIAMPADSIFYPEKPVEESEIETLLRMLVSCDPRSMEVVKATIRALIDTASEKQP